MKYILLSVLLFSTLTSCTLPRPDSAATKAAAAAAGKDGAYEVGAGILKFKPPVEMLTEDNVNAQLVNWRQRRDLVLTYTYYFPEDLKEGAFYFHELQLKEEDLKSKYTEETCTMNRLPHRWVLSYNGERQEVLDGQLVEFKENATLLLEFETRTVPECGRAVFGFVATPKEKPPEEVKPEEPQPSNPLPPRPTPSPTPHFQPKPTPPPSAATYPDGAEEVTIMQPSNRDTFNFTSENKDSLNFKYRVNLVTNGLQFSANTAIEKVYVAVYDKVFKNFVSPWTEIVSFPTATKLPIEFKLQFTLDQFSAPTYMYVRQKDLALVFMVDSYTNSPLPPRSFDIGTYCRVYTRSFIEAETGATGCN